MTVTTVGSDTFESDTIILIRDFIRDNLTDPISGTRQTKSKFVMTSYPQRPVQYPLVTIKAMDFSSKKLGMQSTAQQMSMSIEIRIWARNVKERAELNQSLHTLLRENQFEATGPSNTNNLHNFDLISSIEIDEEGQRGIKSKVNTYQYFAIIT